MKFLTEAQFIEMWKLQDSLNTLTAGENWKNRNLNWNLAIKSEVMEFFDYVGWKWWKEPDKTRSPRDTQARLELVDIWHFLLSSIIQNSRVEALTTYRELKYNLALREPVPGTGTCRDLQELDSAHLSNYAKVELLTYTLDFCDWDWQGLYAAYIGKNILNAFRQEHGYKEGTYCKLWWDREDNVYLEESIQQLVEANCFTAENLKQDLENLYTEYLESLPVPD